MKMSNFAFLIKFGICSMLTSCVVTEQNRTNKGDRVFAYPLSDREVAVEAIEASTGKILAKPLYDLADCSTVTAKILSVHLVSPKSESLSGRTTYRLIVTQSSDMLPFKNGDIISLYGGLYQGLPWVKKGVSAKVVFSKNTATFVDLIKR